MEKIHQALLNTAKTFFTAKQIPVAWENTTFTAPAGPWAAVFFVPVNERIETLGAGGENKLDGILQVDLNYPANSGEGDMRKRIDEVRACFVAGSTLVFESQPVRILSTSCSGGRQVDGFYRKSISVRWQAYISRPS
jgi:hypothetical protein